METPYPDAAPSPQPTDRRPAFLGSSRRFASRATPKASYGIMLRYTVHKENPICRFTPHRIYRRRRAPLAARRRRRRHPGLQLRARAAPRLRRRAHHRAGHAGHQNAVVEPLHRLPPGAAHPRAEGSTTRSSAWPPKCAPRTPTACCWCWAATTATRACCRRESRAWKRPATRFPTSTSTCWTTSRRSAASTSCATNWTSPTPAPGTSIAARTARPSCPCRTSPTR